MNILGLPIQSSFPLFDQSLNTTDDVLFNSVTTTMGMTFGGDVDMQNNQINNLAAPSLATDGVNKGYVDSTFLPFTGGTMTGGITNLRTPDEDITLGVSSQSSTQGVSIGRFSGSSTSGKSISIGSLAGASQTASPNGNNIAIGNNSSSSTGDFNITIGDYAKCQGGGSNVTIGRNAGINALDYSNSVILGNSAGGSQVGDRCVYIGNNAGNNGGDFDNTLVINADTGTNNPTMSNQMKFTAGSTSFTADPTDGFVFNQGLNPSIDNTFNLGSSSLWWKDVFVGGDFRYNKAKAEMWMTENVVSTTISAVNVSAKILGTTTPNSENNGFTHTNNRLEYIGVRQRQFHAGGTISVVGPSGTDREWAISFAKNGVLVPGSTSRMHTVAPGDSYSTSIHSFISLNTNDYVELWLANDSDDSDVVVQDMNVFMIGFPNDSPP